MCVYSYVLIPCTVFEIFDVEAFLDHELYVGLRVTHPANLCTITEIYRLSYCYLFAADSVGLSTFTYTQQS